MIEILAIPTGLIIISWLVLRRTVRKRLERNTDKITEGTERLDKETYYKKEMRKHLGYYMEREQSTSSLSEEENETEGYPSSPVMDEEDNE